uniref:Serpin n=1 Tax=Mimivirus LCMiAC01 TaxID=2506608 RepID=A0A481YZY4_9VIRU|nr:MAG: serpin [Mimivirus LCMiAC01]
MDNVGMYQISSNKEIDNIEHADNVNRYLMERNSMFNLDTNNEQYMHHTNNNNNNQSHNNTVGEITGYTYNTDIRGMPVREYINEILEQDEYNENHNNHNNNTTHNNKNPNLDFDLYDTKPSTNVSYNDPYTNMDVANNRLKFSDINSNNHLLPKFRNNPEVDFSVILNKNAWYLYYLTRKSLISKRNDNYNFVISSLGLILPIIALYRGSADNTENEIKNVFSFMDADKDTTFQLASNIIKKIRCSSYLLNNFIYIPHFFPLNQEYVKYVRDICNIGQIDLRNPVLSHKNINRYIHALTNGEIENTVNKSTINKQTCIVLITISQFNSKWKIPFNPKYTSYEMFYSTTLRKVPMMKLFHSTQKYCEDDVNQVTELDCAHDMCMGIILPKNKSDMMIRHDQYRYYISKLQPTHIKCVSIPKFSLHVKYKLLNLFKQTKLSTLFSNANLSELTPFNDKSLYISDIIHQCIVTVNEGEYIPHKKIKTKTETETKTTINFIANHSFIFYIRYVPTNTILYIGRYV